MRLELKADAHEANRTWERLMSAGYADVRIVDAKTGEKHTLFIEIDHSVCRACGSEKGQAR